MKIVIMNFNRSGLFHYASSLAHAFAGDGDEVLFVTSQYNPIDFVKPNEHLEIFAMNAPHQRYIPFLWQSLNIVQHRQLRKKIASFKPDAILINDVYPWYLLYGKWLQKYPIFVIQHDPILHEGEKKSFLIKKIQKKLQKISKKILQHSGEMPHGSLDLFDNFTDEKEIEAEKNTILFFGRILPYKGLDLLIEAVEKIQNIKLIIAGEGNLKPYQKLLKTKEKYEIENRYIPEREVAQFFKRAQIIVLPYRSATQSGIIPIAYALSRPVIATEVGLLPSVIEDGKTGFLIEPGSVEKLKETIEHALKNPQKLIEMGKNAKKFAAEKFDWKKIVEQLKTAIKAEKLGIKEL